MFFALTFVVVIHLISNLFTSTNGFSNKGCRFLSKKSIFYNLVDNILDMSTIAFYWKSSYSYYDDI